MNTVSVVVPAWREPPEQLSANLRAIHAQLRADDELILVDAGPTRCPLRLERLRVEPADPGRGRQLNAGARLARGRWLLFLHADSRLDPGALDLLRAERGEWGWFRLRLDAPGPAFRLIEAGVRLRSSLAGATGDQGLWVRRSVFEELGGFAAWPLLEDLDLVDRLRRRSPGRSLPSAVTTSARRYLTQGRVRTTLRMWTLRLAFRCGVSPHRLAAHYPPCG